MLGNDSESGHLRQKSFEVSTYLNEGALDCSRIEVKMDLLSETAFVSSDLSPAMTTHSKDRTQTGGRGCRRPCCHSKRPLRGAAGAVDARISSEARLNVCSLFPRHSLWLLVQRRTLERSTNDFRHPKI